MSNPTIPDFPQTRIEMYLNAIAKNGGGGGGGGTSINLIECELTATESGGLRAAMTAAELMEADIIIFLVGGYRYVCSAWGSIPGTQGYVFFLTGDNMLAATSAEAYPEYTPSS